MPRDDGPMRGRSIAAVAAVAVLAALLLSFAATEDDGPWDVRYDTGGGSLEGDILTSYGPGDTGPLPVPSRDGFVFTGWYLDEALTDGPFDSFQGLSGDLVFHAAWIPAEEHSVSYNLYGGSLPNGAQGSFVGGIGTVLPVPVKEGHRFGGWFYDAGYTEPVVEIGRDVLWDVEVHACWTEEDVTGNGFVWDVSGVYYNGDVEHRIDGTLSTEFIAETGSEFYWETRYDITYSWPSGSTHDGRTVTGWSGVDLSGMEYVGTGEACGYPCTIWSDGDGSTIWLYLLWVQVLTVTVDGDDVMVSELSDWYAFQPETSFMPEVTSEYPVSVSGVRETTIGGGLQLTASGDGFSGWYVNGVWVSDDPVLRLDRADPGQRITAGSDLDYVVLESGVDDLSGFGFGAVTVTDDDGSEVPSDIGSLAPGHYVASGPVSGYTLTMGFFVDECRTFSASWDHGGVSYHLSLDLLYSDVYRYGYHHDYMNGYRGSLEDAGYIDTYHTVSDRTLTELVGSLRDMSPDREGAGFASFVLSFVQAIPYFHDSDVFGTEDYWLYPLETLWYGGGDCEDTTILYGTLMSIAGYDVGFVLFADHAMTALAVDGSGWSVSIDGGEYLLCETTNPGFAIGQTSVGHEPSDARFVCGVGMQRGPAGQ